MADTHAHAVAHPPTATGLNTFKLGFWVFLGNLIMRRMIDMRL